MNLLVKFHRDPFTYTQVIVLKPMCLLENNYDIIQQIFYMLIFPISILNFILLSYKNLKSKLHYVHVTKKIYARNDIKLTLNLIVHVRYWCRTHKLKMIRNINVFYSSQIFFTEALQRYQLKLFSQNLTLVLRFIITNWQIRPYYHLKNYCVQTYMCGLGSFYVFRYIKVKFILHIWKIKSFSVKISGFKIFILSYAWTDFLFINLGIRIFFLGKIT